MTENSMVTKDHFSDLRTQLIKIKEDNEKVVFDYENDEKEARSYVATLRKSKTAISNRHKEKKKSILEDGRKLDSAKNELTAEVDEMIEVHAKPLQEIKDRKDAEIELERKRVEQELEDERLKAEQILIDRENEIARKEAELAKIEADRIAKAKTEQDEKDRIEYEARVKADAEEKAKKDAADALLKEQQEKERLIQEAADREKHIKIDAENAEQKRLSDIATEKLRVAEESLKAAEKAEQEKNFAIDKLRREQEEKERLEVKRVADEKAEADRLARNRNHQKSINRKVVAKLMSVEMSELIGMDITEAQAIEIVKDLVKNPINEITINY